MKVINHNKYYLYSGGSMKKNLFVKIFAFLMALCILMNYNMVFEKPGSVPKVEFGQKVEAAATNAFSIPRQTYEIQKSVTYGEDGDVADDVTGTFSGSGKINIDNNRVYGSFTIDYTLKEANKYNTFEYVTIDVYNWGRGIGSGTSKIGIYDINTTSGKPRNSTTGKCTIEFDFYLYDTYQRDDELTCYIYVDFCSTRDYHDGWASIAQQTLPIVEGKKLVLNSSPAINSTSPSQNQTVHGNITPSMNVSDPNGDMLTCNYYIDSKSMESIQTSNTATPQPVSFNTLNTKTLSNGYHTFKFEVSDGKSDPVSRTFSVYVDNSPPVLAGVSAVPNDTSITISGYATDDTTDANSILYNYTVGNSSTGWIQEKTKTIGLLSPDTEYNVKFEAKDMYGNIASADRTIHTKAQVPQLSLSKEGKVSTDSADIQINDQNPSSVLYQLKAGSSYVNSRGELTLLPEWIKLSANKSITVKGLSPNTIYSFTATAKNSLGIETTVSTPLSVTTLAQGPAIEFTKGVNQIIVSWQPVSGALGYIIAADGIEYSTGTTPSFTHKNLQPETTHQYAVCVINAGGKGSFGEYKRCTTSPNPPDTPTLELETRTQTAITIKWNPVAKATGYRIMAEGVEIDMGTNTTYTVEGLQPDTNHVYSVSAKNEGGSSNWSRGLEVKTLPMPPEIPKNLEGKPTRTNITLSWNPAERAESYEIDIDGNTTKSVKELAYVHEGLSAESIHTYRIRAINEGGKSKWSELVTVTTWPEIPGTPTNIIATAEQESITITWYNVLLAESYDVEIDGKEAANVKESSYANNSLEPGSKHKYRVRARNISGAGEWSNPVEISTLPKEGANLPINSDMLSNIIAVVTNKTVKIYWQAVRTDSHYEIEVDGELVDNGRETEYNHTGLEPSSFHTYKVRTKDKDGNGWWCAVLTLSTLPNPPNAPKNLTATASQTQIELKWDREAGTGYDVEIDGKVMNAGEEAGYIDNGLKPGTSHTYRVRGKNITGVTAWSDAITKSTTSPSYEIDCLKDQEFDFSLLSTNVQDFSELTFVVVYNTDELEVKDLCELSAGSETVSGKIPGTNITVKFTAGRIEFTVDENIVSGTTWSGEISTVVFKSKVDGKVSVNFNIE
jgi:hypothetical protein